ncbi:MAG TPA: DUF3576 domain-containing protein [Caulobacteraceae bacterium]
MAFVRGPMMRGVTIGLAALSLAACGHFRKGPETVRAEESRGLFGTGLFKSAPPESQATIGVNGYLWRASLDTLAFMPLASADPYGGVIITDWYADPQLPTERFKATVYIVDTRLRADGLKVSLNKEIAVGGVWTPAEVSPQTVTDLENSILTRARQLRLANINN